MVKGQKRVNQGRNSNTKGSDNIISNGSVVAVNEGQCMIIVEQGGIVDVCVSFYTPLSFYQIFAVPSTGFENIVEEALPIPPDLIK